MTSILSGTPSRQLLTSLLIGGNCSRALATHWDPKFKKLRARKMVKPANLKEDILSTTSERVKNGIEPPLTFSYKPMNLTTTGQIIDPYVPPEGDGKASLFSKEGLKNVGLKVWNLGSKALRHKRHILKYDETFDEKIFGDLAQQIYIDAHTALMNRDLDNLTNFVTETALSKMYDSMKYKTIRWKWIESLEPPAVVHLSTTQGISQADEFAQVTVRLHSKQVLAVYDRFGRLAFGSPTLEKNVLEYIVFEKFLTSMYGRWRVHEKIVPEWAPPPAPVLRTFEMPKLYKVDEEMEKKLEAKFKNDESHLESPSGGSPKLT